MSCRMMRSAGLLLALTWLGACSYHPKRVYHVLVDSYPNPAYAIDRSLRFCIVPGAQAHAAAPLSKQMRYDELATICTEVATEKRVALSRGTAPDCLPAQLDWSVNGARAMAAPANAVVAMPAEPPLLASLEGAESAWYQAPPPAPPLIHNQPPPSDPLMPSNSGTVWQDNPRRASFRKQLTLTVAPRASDVLVEATASLWSDNEAFTDQTARVLCRALLQDFPARVNAKRYRVALEEK